jgi:hypothetical protein
MKIGSLDGHYHVQHVCTEGQQCLPRHQHSEHHTKHFLSHPDVRLISLSSFPADVLQVLKAEQQKVLKRSRRAAVQINDPLWSHQWFLVRL